MKLLVALLFLLALSAVSVDAQRVVYVCPEGTYMATIFGYTECRSISDEPRDPKPKRQSDPNIGSTALGVAMIGSKVLADAARVVKDPKYKGYTDGEWFYDEPASGESCSASFMRQGVGVTVLGPSKTLPGAFLIFFGPNIPGPKTLGKAKITLTQTGDKPQTVQALSTAFPNVDGYGSVIFAVPTIEDSLNGIGDIHKFGITFSDKSVAEIEWSGGLAARDKLRRCVARRPKPQVFS